MVLPKLLSPPDDRRANEFQRATPIAYVSQRAGPEFALGTAFDIRHDVLWVHPVHLPERRPVRFFAVPHPDIQGPSVNALTTLVNRIPVGRGDSFANRNRMLKATVRPSVFVCESNHKNFTVRIGVRFLLVVFFFIGASVSWICQTILRSPSCSSWSSGNSSDAAFDRIEDDTADTCALNDPADRTSNPDKGEQS